MRGVIMSVEGNKAVLLTQGGDFKQIRNKNYNIGDKVKVTTNYAARIGTIAAALAVFAIGGGASYFMPASYVSVDINPSFLMTLNVYNKVIDVEPLNGEAENLLKKADIKGMDINDTVDTLIAESERIGYINENGGEVMVSVVPRMRTPKIEDKNKSDKVNVIVSEADKKELDEAKKMGVSIAMAKAIEEYTDAFGGTVPANAGKLGGMTIGQIKNEIDEKKELESTPAPTIIPSEPSMIRVTENKAPQDNSQISLQSAATPAPTLGTPKLFAETPAPNRYNTANEKNENKPEEVRREDIKSQNADTPKQQPSEKETRETKAPEVPLAPDASVRADTPAASGNQNTKADVPQNSKPAENATEPAPNNSGNQPSDNTQKEQPKEQPKDNAPTEEKSRSNTSPQSSAPKNDAPVNNGGSAPSGNNPPSSSGNSGGSAPSSGGNAPSNGGGAPSNSGGNGGAPSGGGNGGGGAPR